MREQTRRYVENKYMLSVSELKSWFAYRMPYQVPPVSVSSSYGGRVYRLSFVSLSYDGERSLSCRVQSVGESGKTESNFSIEIERKVCNYGGERFYFHCPRCGRRCTKLYLCDGRFECRQCGGLHYEVESLDKVERLRKRVGKIRKRLGWARMGFPELADILAKPKWMHYDTFKRLCDRHDADVGTMIALYRAQVARTFGAF